ncbi:MAG: DUF1624 domain-containing protein [Oscillospiraceae bacterium]|nr:DUF1624 domain-containing protein [Oscillospiraceae bacterium]
MPKLFRKPDLSRRSGLLDSLRGLTVLNMILFHAMYDLVFIFGVSAPWFLGTGAFVWQQAICCTFITLSGFCAAMGKHTLRRGAVVFGIGAAVTLVTLFFMPEELIVFGVLTLIGSCMLLTGAAKSALRRIPAVIGLPVCFALFSFTRPVNSGGLGIFFRQLISLPEWLYHDYVTAYLGFPHPGFRTSDYFSLIPWLFLFLSGFFLHGLCGKQILNVTWKGIGVLNFIGRYALEIYVLHQPLIYGLLLAWNAWLRPLF